MKSFMFVFVAVIYCGLVSTGSLHSESTANRIINGALANIQQFRHAVSIQQIGVTTNTRGHICGGVLVTLQHVITAGSCLYRNNVIIQASQYQVFAGATALTNSTSPDRVRPIANFTIHPQYTGVPALANDIAVVTLTAPFPNETVTPLPLSTVVDPADFTLCTTAGWGGTAANNNPSVNLLYTTMYVSNQKECSMLYSAESTLPNILDTMLCAHFYNTISGGCDSDRGNALVCNGKLTGVLSVSTNCQPIVRPEIFTRVSSYNTWIKSITGGAPTNLPGVFVVILMGILQAVMVNSFM